MGGLKKITRESENMTKNDKSGNKMARFEEKSLENMTKNGKDEESENMTKNGKSGNKMVRSDEKSLENKTKNGKEENKMVPSEEKMALADSKLQDSEMVHGSTKN